MIREVFASQMPTAIPRWRDYRWLSTVVTAAQHGDEQAFDALVVEIGGPLLRFLRLRLRTEADARDALQETLLSAWLGLRSLRRTESFASWIMTIAARKAALVEDNRDAALPTSGLAEADGGKGLDETLQVRLALERLPPSSRDLLLLRYVVGLSERETASSLGIRIGTVKSRTARARRQLASVLGLGDRE